MNSYPLAVITLASIFTVACTGEVETSSSPASSNAISSGGMSSNGIASSSPATGGQSSPTAVSSTAVASSVITASSVTIVSSATAVSSVTTVSSTASNAGEPAVIGEGESGYRVFVRPLVESCGACHAEDNAIQQSPMFAHENLTLAEYELLASGKINFSQPHQSRIVEKINSQPLHNCGTTLADCQALASKLQEAIRLWGTQGVGGLTAQSTIVSGATDFSQSVINSRGERSTENVVARYEFGDCSDKILDTSGQTPALDLTPASGVSCVPGVGLSVTDGGYAVADLPSSQRLYESVAGESGSQQFTVEGWIKFSDPDFAFRNSSGSMFLHYGHGPNEVEHLDYESSLTFGYTSNGRLSSNNTWASRGYSRGVSIDNERFSGDPRLILSEQMVHVALTVNESYIGSQLYFNGLPLSMDHQREGWNGAAKDYTGIGWSRDAILSLGRGFRNAPHFNHNFEGVIAYLSIYDRALSQEQVRNLSLALPGKERQIFFDIADVVGVPNTAIRMNARLLKSGDYSFARPTLITDHSEPLGIELEGMQVAVNGRITTKGQSFMALKTVLKNDQQELTRQGTTVLAEKGQDEDSFTLIFDRIGNNRFERQSVNFPAMTYEPDNRVTSTDGLKYFDQLNQTFSQLTGVKSELPAIQEVYLKVSKSLPSNTSLATFSSAQQLALTNLSFAYCGQMMADSALAGEFYPQVALAEPLTGANQTKLMEDLHTRVIGEGFSDGLQADELAEVAADLIGKMQANGDSTTNIAAALCGVALASAYITVQ